jgi:hypothetical protein
VTFNPTGLTRDGYAPWEVRVVDAQASSCVAVELSAGDDLSPSTRVGLGRDGHVTSMDGYRVVESLAWSTNEGGSSAGDAWRATGGRSGSTTEHSARQSGQGASRLCASDGTMTCSKERR